MQIRRQDKDFINCLRLLGGGLGVILAVLVVLHFRADAKNQLASQRQYVQQNAQVLALANSLPAENGALTNNIDAGFLDRSRQADDELDRLENGFWPTVLLADLTLLCAVSSIAGLIGGYSFVWLISAIGTIGTIKIFRLTYKIIWHIKPDFDGGKQQFKSGDNILIKRNKHRVLPAVVITSIMGLIGLVILLVAVYCWTR